ncbi:hypothetical protein IBX35_00010 [Candidatus Bathyarchaeota archaeon]|nr:hypothetical protein [Candidatus Bathyarchaeota archaeon]
MKKMLRMKCSSCGHWNRVPANKIFIEQPSSEPKVKAYISTSVHIEIGRYELSALIDEVENLINNEADYRNRYYEFFVDQEKYWVKFFKRWDEVKQGYLLTKAFIRRVHLAYESEFLLKRRIERGSQRSVSADIENIFGQMLRAFLKARNLQNLEVRINKKWYSKPKNLQPDILVLSGIANSVCRTLQLRRRKV